MREREQTLRPLLQNIQEIEKKTKEDIKRVWEEEKEKIKEIEEMIRTGEVGERKSKFYWGEDDKA